MLPVIALDIDGVLAPVGSYGHITPQMLEAWPHEAWRPAPRSLDLHVAQPVIDFFLEVHEKGQAQIFWHTTWREDAQGTLSEDLGFPRWELLEDATHYHSSPGWWKLDDVVKRLEAGHRVIWLDDDIDDSEEVAAGEWLSNANLFVLCPALHKGLTSENLEAISAQIEAWS